MTYNQFISASENPSFTTNIYAATHAEDGKVYVFNSGNYLAHLEEAKELLENLKAYISHIDEGTINTFNNALYIERTTARYEKAGTVKKEVRTTNIYLMFHKPTGLHKIGHSVNPEVREGTLNAVDPEVELIHHFPASKSIETLLHNKHKAKRVRGEWFRLTPEDVDEIVNQRFQF